MAHVTWQGTMTFGMVSIPIKMFTAARPQRTSFHQLHTVCHTRLKQPLFCPHCDRIVPRDEVVKGYEYEPGKYALIESSEIKRIMPRSGKAMEILAFVPEDQVDPIYFEDSFLSVPQAEGRKGYALLLRALEQTHMVGIAKVDMHQREYTMFIRPRDHGLTLHTMYYENEIAKVEEYGKADGSNLRPQEVKLAEQLVKTLAEDFKPEQYHDTYQEQLKALVEAKLQGKEIVAEAPAPTPGKVVDIMDALKRSLARSEKRKPAPRPAAGAANRRHKHKAAS